MVTTREVFAVIAGLCFVAGFVAIRADSGVVGSWLFAAGSAFATLWSVASVALAGTTAESLSPEAYLAMAAMAATGAIYYGHRAAVRKPPI